MSYARLVTLFLLLSTTPSLAQSTGETGEELLSDCEQLLNTLQTQGNKVYFAMTPQTWTCWGFVGAVQQFSVMTDNGGTTILDTCLPPQGTLIQLIRIVVNYGQQHPERLHFTAASLATEAMQQAFPCPPNQ